MKKYPHYKTENNNIILIDKKIGQTPYQAIQELKDNNQKFKNQSISHAGKLDPLASGLLLLLIGPEIKNIKKYMNLDKTYIAEILLGFSSDSNDIQGIATKNKLINPTKEEVIKILESFSGTYLQTLPIYSGRMVKGRPLYYYARKNKLDKIKIPTENVTLKNIKFISLTEVSTIKLLKEIIYKINLLDGDFRQEEIIKQWKSILINDETYKIIKIKITCSSGTYIRAIADDFGKRIGNSALLYELRRTSIGNFHFD